MVGIVAAGWTPRVEVIIALAVAVAVASVAVRQLGDSTEVLRWPRRRPTVAAEEGADARVGFLEHSLRRSGEDDTAFAMRVRPVLVAVSTHRLRRAGVDIDTEPDAARQLLGDDAWDVLTAPTSRSGGSTSRPSTASSVEPIFERANRITVFSLIVLGRDRAGEASDDLMVHQ